MLSRSPWPLVPSSAADARRHLRPRHAGELQRQLPARPDVDRRDALRVAAPAGRTRRHRLDEGGCGDRQRAAALRCGENGSGARQAVRASRPTRRGVSPIRAISIFNDKYSAALLTIDDDLVRLSRSRTTASSASRTSLRRRHRDVQSRRQVVAFVRGNNLFVVDIAAGAKAPLTTDGAPKILNGRLDWVYEEEIYGRGDRAAATGGVRTRRASRSSASTTRRFRRTSRVDHIPYDQTVETWDYPKAGDPNPIAKLGVVRAAGGTPSLDRHLDVLRDRFLIVRVGWTPDSRQVVYEVQNRTQTWLDLERRGRRRQHVAHAPARDQQALDQLGRHDDPIWLEGRLVSLAQRAIGWQHLYHYRADGTLIKQVTDGKWELRTLHGIDEPAAGSISPAPSAATSAATSIAIKLDGTGLQRLSKADGTHDASFSPGFDRTTSTPGATSTTPPQMRLHKNDGSRGAVIDENQVAALARVPALEAGVRAGEDARRLRDGSDDDQAAGLRPVAPLSGVPVHLRRPARASRCATPGAAREYMYHQLLAQKGIIVWVCDNRTASGKGTNRPGRFTGISASSSCATSKTAWLAEAAAVGGRHRASAFTAGATAAS